jgi:prevent-host-death family protein
MTTANVHQAKSNLSKLLNAAADGDDVVITRRGGKITQFKLIPVDGHLKLPLFGALKLSLQMTTTKQTQKSSKCLRIVLVSRHANTARY